MVFVAPLIRPPGKCPHAGSLQEPSNHRVQFVAVDDGVRMEVLDWGGSGKAVVLLAGLGYTAHVSDDFAEKLAATRSCHARQREPPLSPNRPAAEPVKSS